MSCVSHLSGEENNVICAPCVFCTIIKFQPVRGSGSEGYRPGALDHPDVIATNSMHSRSFVFQCDDILLFLDC